MVRERFMNLSATKFSPAKTVRIVEARMMGTNVWMLVFMEDVA